MYAYREMELKMRVLSGFVYEVFCITNPLGQWFSIYNYLKIETKNSKLVFFFILKYWIWYMIKNVENQCPWEMDIWAKDAYLSGLVRDGVTTGMRWHAWYLSCQAIRVPHIMSTYPKNTFFYLFDSISGSTAQSVPSTFMRPSKGKQTICHITVF